MMKRIFIFALGFCTLQVSEAMSQDFIVTKSGDTINGVMNKTLLGKLILQRADAQKFEVAVDDVNCYYLAGKRALFIAKQIPKTNKPCYVEVLERGKINLYERQVKTPEGVIITTWYANKDSDVLEDIITSQLFSKVKPREELFLKMISDNETLLAAYNHEKKYNFGVKRDYIRAYNLAAK